MFEVNNTLIIEFYYCFRIMITCINGIIVTLSPSASSKPAQTNVMLNTFTQLSLATTAVSRQSKLLFTKPLTSQTGRFLSTRSNLSDDEKHERFFQMEHENWEKGFEAYDVGFGPLTRQTIPTLLSKAGEK